MKRFSALALLALAGCYSAELEAPRISQTDVEVAAEHFRPLGDFDVPGSHRYKGDDPDAAAARMELLDSVTDDLDAVRSGLNAGSDWQERTAVVRRVMDDPEMSEPQAWFVDQIGASMVLERILGEGVSHRSEPAKAAAGHFVEVLVDRESPNAPLIAEGLEMLKGYWPGEKIRSVATRAAREASSYLDDCEVCDQSAQSGKVTRPAEDRERRMIAAGMTRLLELARISE